MARRPLLSSLDLDFISNCLDFVHRELTRFAHEIDHSHAIAGSGSSETFRKWAEKARQIRKRIEDRAEGESL